MTPRHTDNSAAGTAFFERRPERDVSPADWILGSVGEFGSGVGSVLPRSFAAYARVFHPAWLDGREARWADIATANGRVAHPGMEWGSITGSWRHDNDEQPGVWDDSPSMGSLPSATARELGRVLAAHTASERYWFAVWEGHAALPREWSAGPALVRMPQRNMHLFRGSAADVGGSFEDQPWEQTASLWWPDDRAWCVATDVDLVTTYVGASSECVAAIVAAAGLEAMPVPLEQTLHWQTDTVNLLPDSPWA